MALGDRFRSLFKDRSSRQKLEQLSAHTVLPTFNLTTTSLRHLPRWLDRLEEIDRGVVNTHGNFFSDPATIGLVDNSVRPRVLTLAGRAFLNQKAAVYNKPEKAEYQLIKILYFSNHVHNASVQEFLRRKREHMDMVLRQFSQTSSRPLFLERPSLLVIAELIAGFPGALPGFASLSRSDLFDLARLGEGGFVRLCLGAGFPPGIQRLCRRIGSDYTRGEERRLHYIVSMALLTIAQMVPPHTSPILVVPPPFSNLLTESDVYHLHMRYTSDINVWFDGISFRVSSLSIPITAPPPLPPIPLAAITLLPQIAVPSGTGNVAAGHASRKRIKSARQSKVTIIVDQLLSQRSEDFIQEIVLGPRYGAQLVRVGHRSGETLALLDGMVPGADFYVIDAAATPVRFIEVKSISSPPPADIQLTRAEYLRACQCERDGIPYELILVNTTTGNWCEVLNFSASINAITLGQVLQFAVRVG